MDRGYVDFKRLYTIHQSSAFFVTRAKSNFNFRRLYSKPVDKSTVILCDQIIVLNGFYAKKAYPDKLRRACRHSQKAIKTEPELIHNFTDFKCITFRENTHIATTYIS